MKAELKKLTEHLRLKGTVPYSAIKEDIQMNTFYVLLWDGKFRVDIDVEGEFIVTYTPVQPEPMHIYKNANLGFMVAEFSYSESQRVAEDAFDYNTLLTIMKTVYPRHPQFRNPKLNP